MKENQIEWWRNKVYDYLVKGVPKNEFLNYYKYQMQLLPKSFLTLETKREKIFKLIYRKGFQRNIINIHQVLMKYSNMFG